MEKISADLTTALVNDVEIYKDEDATVDTSAAGEFFIEMLAEITTLVDRLNFECLNLDEGFVPYKIGDFYVFLGEIETASLVRFETLTFDDSGATLALAYGADLTVGTGQIIVCRLLAGVITVADAVLTGAAGTLTLDAAGAANLAGGANNRCPGIGGRLQVLSTGLADASQTSEPVAYLVEGTKV